MSDWSYTRVGAKDGKGIQSITEYYKLSANTTETFSDSTISTWSTSVSQPTSANPYLLNAELVVYSDGTKEYKAPHVASRYVTDGQSGRGIAGITEYYLATSESSGVTRSTSGWTNTIQTMTSTKKYLWNYEETTYTDDSDSSYTNPCIIGVYGDNGDKGDTGAKALQPKKNFTSTYTTIGGTTSWDVSNFNRTPVVGDTFTNLDGSSNTGTWQVTAISGTTVTIKLLSFVNSKGATGAKGDPGSKGDKGDTGTRGSVWYSGTGITGTSTTATVFSGSGVSSALVGDMYKNTSTNYTYRCTVAGNASTAKWVYTGNLTGAKGDKGDKGDTGGTGSRAPKYRGPGSAPTTDLIVGDWYLNTSDGKVYVRAASSWTAQSTTTPNQYHLACINDMVSLLGTTTNATVKANLQTICDAYVERLLVGTAFVKKLFTSNIEITTASDNGVIKTSNFTQSIESLVSDTVKIPTKGFQLWANSDASDSSYSEIDATRMKALELFVKDIVCYNLVGKSISVTGIDSDTGLPITNSISGVILERKIHSNSSLNNKASEAIVPCITDEKGGFVARLYNDTSAKTRYAYSRIDGLSYINSDGSDVYLGTYSNRKKFITERDILTSRTSVNSSPLSSLVNITSISITSTTGNIIFSNGMIIKFGKISAAGEVNKRITFPTAFPNYCIQVHSNHGKNNTSSVYTREFAYNWDKSGFYIRTLGTDNPAFWIAFGY